MLSKIYGILYRRLVDKSIEKPKIVNKDFDELMEFYSKADHFILPNLEIN